MSKKTNVNTGVERLKAAAKNPANGKLFDAFITGALDESVVDPSYTEIEIDFSDEEIENVCKLLTRGRIGAYQNDTNRSATELIAKYLKLVNGDQKDPVVEANMAVMTDILDNFSPDVYEDDYALSMSVSALFKNLFQTVLGTPVVVTDDTPMSTAANESVKVDEPDTDDKAVLPVVVENDELSSNDIKELQMSFNDMKDGKISKTEFYKVVKEVVNDERILEQMLDIINKIKVAD